MSSSKMTRGIVNDIRAISTYAHYVDAMFIDKECAHMLAEGPLNAELDYKARIFSFADPKSFIDYLKELEASSDPFIDHYARMLYGL